jgi:sugar phosphate isomerase/epimerase
MITPGLVSVTFRDRPAEEVAALARDAGLRAIEWSGDAHLPRGDIGRAHELAALSSETGLRIAGFGSYYRVGHSEADGYGFETVLDEAVALGAPAIRVWAGTRGSAEADEPYRAVVARESRRIADLAASRGIRIVFEWHAETLTDTAASALRLLQDTDHPNVRTLWQPHNGVEAPDNLAGLRAVLPWVQYLHVFHWWPTHHDRLPLADGEDRCLPYLDAAATCGRDLCALLEFVPDDSLDSFHRDAAVLRAWCEQVG